MAPLIIPAVNWNISATAIRNPIPVIVLFLGLTFAGLTAYFRLPINQVPDIEFPALSVMAAQPGAAPAELERQVSQKIEAALTGIDGVKRMETTITPGVSQTFVELEIGADLTRAVEEARDAVSRIRQDLPSDLEEPIIGRVNAVEEPIAYMAVEGKGLDAAALSWLIDDALTRELLAVKGVSQIRRLGGVDREVRVELDPERLLSFGITASEVSRQLSLQNVDLPGGRASVGGQAQSIRTLGGAETVESLGARPIVLADGRTVRLQDLGAVSDGQSELALMSRNNGQPVISFLVLRAKGSSEVHTYDAFRAKIAEIEARGQVTFKELGSPVDFIKGMHESSLLALFEGALLAVLVVLVVLRDWRATLIAACAIPLAVIPTFAAIEPLGFTLNMITLIALALVAGVLVDDAIVEIENIVRHMRMGKDPFRASLEAADEIGLAVVATSATIIAVFLPVSFMSGVTGQFFKEFGITVALAVFFSLLVARLVTPLMAAYFLRDAGHEEKPTAMRAQYEKALRWSVRRPFVAAAAGIAIFIASLALAAGTPFTFLPRLDNGSIQAKIEFAPGTPLEDADRILLAMAEAVSANPHVESAFSSVGSADGAAGEGSLTLQLTDRQTRTVSDFEVGRQLRPILRQFPDVRTSFLNFQGGGRGSDVMLDFVSDDYAAAAAAADALVAQLRAEPRYVDVASSASLKRPEIRVEPLAEEAARLGVSAADIATAVRIATSGDVDQNLAKFDLADRQVPIRVLLKPQARIDLDAIKALRVRSALGGTVRLDAVADVRFALGEAQLSRRDRRTKVTVSANVIDGQPGDALNLALSMPAAVSPPPGVSVLAAGDSENTQEFLDSFGTAMLWGVLLIYGVLVLLFRDFFQPLTIMTALPLSIGGAFLGLLIANQPFSLFVGVGLVMLMGIVTKNSILLVDFAIERMRKGVSRNEALVEAGMKRARPILMTTAAMSAGMIPAAAGWGIDGALRQGMGVAVIGGLILSTLLSLLFVPAVFVLIDRLQRVVMAPIVRLRQAAEGQAAARTPAE